MKSRLVKQALTNTENSARPPERDHIRLRHITFLCARCSPRHGIGIGSLGEPPVGIECAGLVGDRSGHRRECRVRGKVTDTPP